MKNKKFIFIGGLHRSGTSLVHEILRDHPKISGFQSTSVPEDEGQHLQSVYPSAECFGGPGRFGFDESSFMDDSHPLASIINAEKLFDEWGCYWNMQCDYLIEKSPPNLVRTRFLQSMFENSIFIVIFRHPIALSYATKKWSKTSIHSLLEHSFLCYERFLADLPYLRRCFVLRYEDFISSPQETINQIYQLIGIDTVLINRVAHTDVNERYFELWREDNAGWLSRLRLLLNFEMRARCIGYSLKNPEKLISVKFLSVHS